MNNFTLQRIGYTAIVFGTLSSALIAKKLNISDKEAKRGLQDLVETGLCKGYFTTSRKGSRNFAYGSRNFAKVLLTMNSGKVKLRQSHQQSHQQRQLAK